MFRQWLVMGFAVAVTAGWATAQELATNVRVQKLSVLLKSKVLIQEDQPAGQVVDVVFSEGGCLDYVVVSHEKQYYAIPYSAVTMRYADQIVFVDVAPAQFRKVQFFSNTAWPDFYADNFRQQTFSTFAVKSLRADGERSTFKRDTDRKGDADNTKPRSDSDKPKLGSDTPKAERGDPAPRPKLEPGKQPDADKSVTPNPSKKPGEPTLGDKPDRDTKKPETNPTPPAAKTPLPKSPEAPKSPKSPKSP